jgi:hypothetical protein
MKEAVVLLEMTEGNSGINVVSHVESDAVRHQEKSGTPMLGNRVCGEAPVIVFTKATMFCDGT